MAERASVRAVTPYLVVEGAAAAIDWYVAVLGAVEITRMTGGAGRVAHAELRLGPATIYLGEEHPHHESILGPAKVGGSPVYLDLETDVLTAVFERAVAHGAEEIRQPTDPDDAMRSAKFRDPFGHIWLLTQPEAVEPPA
jgi:PhnB protein